MLRQHTQSSDSSGRRGNRPASFPNNNPNGVILKDLSKSFKNLKVNEKKKSKRNSLTDSEASDNAGSLQPSRNRGAGGGVVMSSRPATNNHHARALREIRSSLQPYAAPDISLESVQNLAREFNLDQTSAERYTRNCTSLEAARENLIQVLTRKMVKEKQMPQANMNRSQMYTVESQHGDYHTPIHLSSSREPFNNTACRGSPDGASLRAESPVAPMSNNGNPASKITHVNNLRQMLANQDYEVQMRASDQHPKQLPHQYQMKLERPHVHEPPAYPGAYAVYQTHSYSPQSSLSDNGSAESGMLHAGHHLRAQGDHQSPGMPNAKYSKSSGRETNVGVAIVPGHVKQIVQSLSPSSPLQTSAGFFRDTNPKAGTIMAANMTSASVMNENHKPIIKGSSNVMYQPSMASTNSNTTPGVGFGHSNLPSHPPPCYMAAQQFRSIQKHTVQPMCVPDHSGPRHSDTVRDQQMHDQASRGYLPYTDQQWPTSINVALMGNVNPPSYQHPPPGSALSSSPQSSISSNYQNVAEPCHAFMTVSSKPVSKPQPMTADIPMNCHQQTIPDAPSMMSYQFGNSHYISHRDPPSYGESILMTSNSEDTGSSQGGWDRDSTQSSEVAQRYSSHSGDSHKGFMRKPSVADNYLNAVEVSATGNTNGNCNNIHAAQFVSNPTPNALPKGTESAVKAARVTASNSKRHACSYSAASDAKQLKQGSVSGTTNALKREPKDLVISEPSDNVEKTIRTSPVPIRKKSKKSNFKARSKSSNAMGSDSEEDEEDLSQPDNKGQGTRRVKIFSPAAYKFYMEQHIENIIKGCRSRESRRRQLEEEMQKMNLPVKDQEQMRTMLYQKESNYIRLKRGKIDLSMFRMVKPLGVGAFGTVYLACKTTTGALYAIKTLRKNDVLKRNQVAHVKAERDILSEADNDWVVRLYYTFQDKQFLYFVMDYIPGGDMMSLLIKKGIFEEPLAQFYTAELTLALESVHRMGFIHRDIKPDNILIDRDGHIKLTDFGLCTGFRWTHDSKYYQREGHMRQDSMDFSNEWSKYGGCLKTLDRRRLRDANRHIARSLVGTPNYIAPEVLQREGYTQLCDWWSVGVILYEMVVGQPPFNASSPEETQMKVINWKKMLYFPDSARLHRHTKDLILRLCCNQKERLGCNGIDEIKMHPYFRNINWTDLRKKEAMHVPRIRYPEDTSNFDPPDEDFMLHQSQAGTLNNNTLLRAGEHAFFEFTFRRFFDEDGRAYASSHHYNGHDNVQTLDKVDEDDSQDSYRQTSMEDQWMQGGGAHAGNLSEGNDFYI